MEVIMNSLSLFIYLETSCSKKLPVFERLLFEIEVRFFLERQLVKLLGILVMLCSRSQQTARSVQVQPTELLFTSPTLNADDRNMFFLSR